MRNVSRKIVAVLSAVAMSSTLLVGAEAASSGTYDAFGSFSTYNYGASQWGPNPSTANADGISVTDIDGGKKIAVANTVAKLQFRTDTDAVPTGYEWYTVSGSIKVEGDIYLQNGPNVYEGSSEAGDDAVISMRMDDDSLNPPKYVVASNNDSDNRLATYRNDFADWTSFKYVVHNTSEETTVYAYLNDNYLGSAVRTAPANGVGYVILNTTNANSTGNVYLKDFKYTWSNDDVEVPSSIKYDNESLINITDNTSSFAASGATLGYDEDNDAIAMYATGKSQYLRFNEGIPTIGEGSKYYKQSFKFKRDANYGAGVIKVDAADCNGRSAFNLKIYRCFGWNQIQVMDQYNSTLLTTYTGYDDTNLGQIDIYYDVANNTASFYLNDEELVSYQPSLTLTNLQRLEVLADDLYESYTTNDGKTAPLRYLVKDYELAWGESDFRPSAEDANTYDAFGSFSTYNLGATQWGPEPSTAKADGISVTDIDGGKKIAVDTTVAKLQFRTDTDAVPTGYEWYTVSGSIKVEGDIYLQNGPDVYEGSSEAGDDVVISTRMDDTSLNPPKYVVASNNDSANRLATYRNDFADWTSFKYVVHNTSEKTTVYAYLNDNYLGSAVRTAAANGVGYIILYTAKDKNRTGNVYLKDFKYTWSNDDVEVPSSIKYDNESLINITDNTSSFAASGATLGYDEDNDAIAMYATGKSQMFRINEGIPTIGEGSKYYKQSFKFKRDSNYGAGTVLFDIGDKNNRSAFNVVVYRCFGWNQIQVKDQYNSTKLVDGYGYNDVDGWGQIDVYYDVANNTASFYLNDEELISYQPQLELANLQNLQVVADDLRASYTTNNEETAPFQYFIKDYELAWSDSNLKPSAATSYDAFGSFSTYNLGASQWGANPSEAGEMTVTDIEGGKKITFDNTNGKLQFNPGTDNVPTGYEWYTITGSVKAEGDIKFQQVPYVYVDKEVSNTNVISTSIDDATLTPPRYAVRTSSNSDRLATFRADFADWTTFKYIVHNTASATTVYAYVNDVYLGSLDRATPADAIGSMMVVTQTDANHTGTVYLKDFEYAWTNEAIEIPTSVKVDSELMNNSWDNSLEYDSTFTYSADDDALAYYVTQKGAVCRFNQDIPTMGKNSPYYKTSFKFKRDGNYGAGTPIVNIHDVNGNSAAKFVIYRCLNWNQIQIRDGSSTTVYVVYNYKDEEAWGQIDLYYEVSTNTVSIYLNDVEQYSYQPETPLKDIQYAEVYMDNLRKFYEGDDSETTAPFRYLFKDYTVAWGEHDLRYTWEEGSGMELVNANITGVTLDSSIGEIPAKNMDQVSIINTATGEAVEITGSSLTGHYTYLDAELEIGVEYVLTVNGGIEGLSGKYTGDTYTKAFKINKVAEQFGSDYAGESYNTVNSIASIGDAYFIKASIPQNKGSYASNSYTNFTQVFDVLPLRHWNNQRTWANDVFKMSDGKNLELTQNVNGESFDSIVVNGSNKGAYTLRTPLGMGTIEMGRDGDNNPDGVFKYFTDGSGNEQAAPSDVPTNLEVFTVSNDAFRVYSNASGSMKCAFDYYDEANVLTNSGYVELQASGRMAYALKHMYVTVPEFIDVGNEEVTDTALINASKDGVVLSSSIGSIYGTSGITVKNAETGASVAVTGTYSAGKNVYVDAELDSDVVYQISIAKGTKGRNGTITEAFTKYFKLTDVETIATNNSFKDLKQGTDEYGDFYAIPQGYWVNTNKYYGNVTVTIKAQRYGAYGYGTYSNEIIRKNDNQHNYAMIYHNQPCDTSFDIVSLTYNSDTSSYDRSTVSGAVVGVSNKNGTYKTDSAESASQYVPVTDANGLPVYTTVTAPYTETINMSGDVLSLKYDDSTPYTYVFDEGYLPSEGSFGYEASIKAVAKIYDYAVTTMEIVEQDALDVEDVSVNANGINVKFSGNVDSITDFSAITLSADGEPVEYTSSASASTLTITPTAGMVSGAVYKFDIASGFGNLFCCTDEKYSKVFKLNIYAKSTADATVTGTKDDITNGVIFSGNLGIDSAAMAAADKYTVEFDYADYLALNDSEDFDAEWNYDTEVPATSVYTTASSASAAPVNGKYFQFAKSAIEVWNNTSSNGSKVSDGASVNTKYGDAYAGSVYSDLLGGSTVAVVPVGTDFESLGYDFYDGSEGYVNQTSHQATTYAYKLVKDGANVTLYRDGAKVGEIADAANGYFGIEASGIEFVAISDLMAYSVEDVADGIVTSLDTATSKVVVDNYGESKSAVVVVAAYSSTGAMIDSDIISITAESGSTEVSYDLTTTGAARYGVMVWDAMTTLNPLTSKLTVLK